MSITKTTQRLTFNKSERLKSRKAIQSIFVQNRHLKIYPFKLVWLTEPDEQNFSLKMGVTATKRLHKLAVTRNFIKRRMRECLRLNKMLVYNELSNKNIKLSFMLMYIGNEIVTYQEFDKKIKQLLIRLTEKINKTD